MPTRSSSAYVLGHSPQEQDRLATQGRTLAAHTRMVFKRAGLAPGQRILDIGCGVGDVSFIAAELVGDTGSVVGMDKSPAAIERARERARAGGYPNVEFVVGDVTDPKPPGKFDAIVGRIVLMYLPDPVEALARLRPSLRSHGVIVMQEGDLVSMAAEPECPLFTQVREWIVTGFSRVGCATQMGSRLASVMHRAGLVPDGSWVSQPSYVGPDLAQLDWFADVIRTILPTLEQHQIVTAEEVDVGTLSARLHAEARSRDAIVLAPRLVGIWARFPSP